MRITLLAAAVAAVAACSSSPDPAKPPPLGQGGFGPAGGGNGGGNCDTNADADGDGYDSRACEGLDCDDASAAVHPDATEACGNTVDDNCNGNIDEGCGCKPGDMKTCWDGDAAVQGVGACHDGVQRCLPSGNWSLCSEQVKPVAEGDLCDGIDQDCDGETDTPACFGCAPDAVEICGNGLDDDCEGHIDNAEICTLSCGDVNPRGADPGPLGCCLHDPPTPFSYQCEEYPGLEACDTRACVDLDGDISTRCNKFCDAGTCVCGRRDGTNILPSPDCGFQTPCSHVDCDDRQDQACYSGPPATLGVGICHAGQHSCEGVAGQRAWTECLGEQVPLVDGELCGNGVDDDCDGQIDEADGSTGKPCFVRTDCVPGADELCGNGLDDDCDGFADEACPALAGTSQVCWTGSLVNRGVGTCKDGRQLAQDDGTFGPCNGVVLPTAEICGDKLDTDCNGLGGPTDPEEASCCVPGTETCNGLDDDCDGVADDGLLNRCGLCDGSCYSAVIDDVADCNVPGRTCEDVEPFALDHSLLTLSLQPPPEPSDVIYVMQSGTGFGAGSLLQLDALTGQPNWSKPLTNSTFFGQVASSPDGTGWASTSSQNSSTLEHYAKDGTQICKATLDTSTSTMQTDAGGDLWLTRGGMNARSLRRYSSTQVQAEQSPGVPWPDGIPRCVIVDLTPAETVSTDVAVGTYDSFALDPNRRVWLTTGNNQGVSILDLVDGQLHKLSGLSGASPALGVDGALYLGGPLRQVLPETVYSGTVADIRTYAGYNIGSLNAAPDGTIWGQQTQGTDTLFQVDPIAGVTSRSSVIPYVGQFATGMTLDGYGKAWTAAGNDLVRFDPLSQTWEHLGGTGNSFSIGAYSSDRAARDLGRHQGSWSQVFDPGSYDVLWDELAWASYAPSGTRVVAVVRFSDVPDLLPASNTICGPFDVSPADISACSGGKRYARVELLLSGYGDPVAGDVKLTWSRP